MSTPVTHPWLSIIIPIYNAERYLRECLDSILKQSFTNYEILLIDDGSTDASSRICNNYTQKDNRFAYFKKANGGSYQTRIYGTTLAHGEYITFCDADDFYLSKDSFKTIYDTLISQPCSALQFGYTKKYRHFSRSADILKSPFLCSRTDFVDNEYPKLLCSFWDTAHLTPNVWNKVYHRDLLMHLPSPADAERIFWGDDLITNLHLLEHCTSFIFIPNILYGYRQLSGGTSRFSRREMDDLNLIKKYQLSFLARYPKDDISSIESILFSEVAGWFFYYIQTALNHVDQQELTDIIQHALELPSFKQARQYYIHNTSANWEAACLLRQGDIPSYITHAAKQQKRNRFKSKLKTLAKRILASI